MTHRLDEVFPRFKVPSPPRPPRRGLRAIGKKGRADRRALAKTKPILIERSGGACEAHIPGWCTGRGQHQHHVLRRSQGGKTVPENLKWTCWSCHEQIHAHPNLAISFGLLARPIFREHTNG